MVELAVRVSHGVSRVPSGGVMELAVGVSRGLADGSGVERRGVDCDRYDGYDGSPSELR